MFSEFVAPYEVKGLTREAVRTISDLDWVEVDQTIDLPHEPGVYGWFHPSSGLMAYHGSGSGAGGLYTRLANQLRWRGNQRDRLSEFEQDASEENGYNLASEVPVIREYTERNLVLFVAVAQPAGWTVPTGLSVPANAVEWESFLYAASHLATGRRSIIGGGAWENKAGSLADHMTSVAWDRLVAVSTDWRK